MFQSQNSCRNRDQNSHQIEDEGISRSETNREVDLSLLKEGLWSQEEVFKFISFLIFNKEVLKLKLQRRTSKIFKQMAAFINTRNSVQCRSQNQRLFRKYRNIKNIVASFKEEYGRDRFESDYSRIISDPAIKFKTQYQEYLERHGKTCEASTQTEEQIISEYEDLKLSHPVTFGCQFFFPINGTLLNWIIPYCS